jgi:hypothetical protein
MVNVLKTSVRTAIFKDTGIQMRLNPIPLTAGKKNKFEDSVAILKAEWKGVS